MKTPSPNGRVSHREENGDEIPLDEILRLFTLPRTVGINPANGEPVIANKGKYGPYVGSAGGVSISAQ